MLTSVRRNSDYQISPDFKEKEFFSKSPDFKKDNHVLDLSLIIGAQIIRDFVKNPVFVTSSYRTPLHNQSVGGSSDSYHLKSMALDLSCGVYQSLVNENILRRGVLYIFLRGCGINGFGLSDRFIHIDTRLSGSKQDPEFGSYELWSYDS